MRRLQELMPKWIHDSYDETFTRSNFVLSVLDLLEKLKRRALRDHNVRITSAIISRPTWVYLDMNFVFEEACFLADIECLEPSHDRTEIVTKTAPPGRSVLVLDLGPYHLDLRYAKWDDLNKRYTIQGSMGIDAGSLQIFGKIAWDLVNSHISNATQVAYFPTHADNEHPMQQIVDAI